MELLAAEALMRVLRAAAAGAAAIYRGVKIVEFVHNGYVVRDT